LRAVQQQDAADEVRAFTMAALAADLGVLRTTVERMVRRTRPLAHGLAFAVVATAVIAYAISGGIVATPPGPGIPFALGVVVALICLGVTEAVARLQHAAHSRDIWRPLVWAPVVGWLISLFLLLEHPASLRSGRPIVSSAVFALVVASPFMLYWLVFSLAGRGSASSEETAAEQ